MKDEKPNSNQYWRNKYYGLPARYGATYEYIHSGRKNASIGEASTAQRQSIINRILPGAARRAKGRGEA